MINKRDKRGESNWGVIFGLIIGVIVIIFVVSLLTGGFGPILEFFGLAKIDIEAISQRCEILSSGSTGYCNDPIEISKNNYVNCKYADENLGVEIGGVPPDCDDDDSAKAICSKFALEQGSKYQANKIKVNGKTCEEWGVTSPR